VALVHPLGDPIVGFDQISSKIRDAVFTAIE